MKEYNRLRLLRKLGPFVMVISMIVTQNLLVISLLALLWIFIDFKFFEPKLPRKRKRIVGEVFVVEPIKNTFFIGKVIRTNIPINDPDMNGGHLVYIYQQASNPLDIPDYLDLNHLLIPPQIIDNSGWEKGNFQTVGIQYLTNEEVELDYGFWDIVTKKFLNEEGKELNHTPTIYDNFGLITSGSVTDKIRKVLNAS